MRRFVLVGALMLATAGCEVYIEGETAHAHESESTMCVEPEPYGWSAEVYRNYYDHHDYYAGECGEWYVGHGWHEEWCNWVDVCGWEYVGEYRTY